MQMQNTGVKAEKVKKRNLEKWKEVWAAGSFGYPIVNTKLSHHTACMKADPKCSWMKIHVGFFEMQIDFIERYFFVRNKKHYLMYRTLPQSYLT